MKDEDYEARLERDIEKKIQQMEAADYEYPKAMTAKDYFLVILIVAVSLFGVVAGAFL